MVEVQESSWLMFSAYAEFPALIAEYAAESSIAGMPSAMPDEALYLLLERSGKMRILTALVDGALVGFVIMLVNQNPHYSVKLAVFESFFVARAARKTGAGLALRKRAELVAAESGAVGVLISAPAGGRLAKVMERDRQYVETNRVFFRRLA